MNTGIYNSKKAKGLNSVERTSEDQIVITNTDFDKNGAKEQSEERHTISALKQELQESKTHAAELEVIIAEFEALPIPPAEEEEKEEETE